MKKYLILYGKKCVLIQFLFIIFCFISCDYLNMSGGVTGNIEKYEFSNTTEETLKKGIEEVYIKYPEMVKKDSVLYGNRHTDYYFLLVRHEDSLIFCCQIIPSKDDVGIELALTTATKYGDVMSLASNIPFFKKIEYKKQFEKNILPKIEKIVGYVSD